MVVGRNYGRKSRRGTRKKTKTIRKMIGAVTETKRHRMYNKLYATSAVRGDLLNLIPIGDEYYERDGRQVLMTNLRVRGFINKSTADTSNTSNVVRLVVVRWKKPQGAGTLAPEKVFQYVDEKTPDTAHDNVTLTRNYKFLEDYTILSDKLYIVGPQGHKMAQPFNINVKLNIRETFCGDATASTDIDDNGLYLLAFSDLTNATEANNPAVYYQSILQYKDI